MIIVYFLFVLSIGSVVQADNRDRLAYAPSGLKWNIAVRYDVDLNGDGQLENVIFMTDAEWSEKYGGYMWEENHSWQLRISTDIETKILFEQHIWDKSMYYLKVGILKSDITIEEHNPELPVILLIEKNTDYLKVYITYYTNIKNDYNLKLLFAWEDVTGPIINELDIWYPDTGAKLRAGKVLNTPYK